MTERLYYTDSCMLEFRASVTGIDYANEKYRITLDRSAFYPTSGGQLFDTGYISGERIVDVIEENGEIVHILDKKPAFLIGDKVEGKIDPARRRDNMQKHTGQHILSRAFIEICGAETISARMGQEDTTIDLDRDQVSKDDSINAEDLANLVIFQNRPVEIDFVSYEKLKEIPLRKIPDRQEGDFRIVTIKDFDWSACGGTHCSATGSVGIIKITGKEKIRGNLRVRFLTGLKALDDYRWRFDQIETISNLFTRHGRESLDAIKALNEENKSLRRQVAGLRKELLPTLVDGWYDNSIELNGNRIIALDLSGQDFKAAKGTALAIINKYDVVVLVGIDDKLLVAASKSLAVSAADIIRNASERFGGKGGGTPQLAQGGGFNPEDIKVLIADPGLIINV
jgi:alanyl-tRNA synthetase